MSPESEQNLQPSAESLEHPAEEFSIPESRAVEARSSGSPLGVATGDGSGTATAAVRAPIPKAEQAGSETKHESDSAKTDEAGTAKASAASSEEAEEAESSETMDQILEKFESPESAVAEGEIFD